MRYLIYFRDKSSIHVPQRVGEEVIKAKAQKFPAVMLNGACFDCNYITVVKPIKAGWFPQDFVEKQDRLELASPDAIKLLCTTEPDV